ncbi:MAG: hypothetical protein IPF99_43385 [Deltaproteobacteria bacterium]|nr:hypothetical protein [Deltaproteobacteria bacterium]
MKPALYSSWSPPRAGPTSPTSSTNTGAKYRLGHLLREGCHCGGTSPVTFSRPWLRYWLDATTRPSTTTVRDSVAIESGGAT